ncbi:MAG: sulfatase [Planctomycetota bacterium]
MWRYTIDPLLRSDRKATASIVVAVTIFAMAATCCAAERMNVVFILADDLGWSDTTLYGTTEFYQTPNVQRLAERGMTFTRAYSSSPLCSPTRASILTGLAPARHGITSPNCHLGRVNLQATPGASAASDECATAVDSVNRLATTHETLVKAFKRAGYRAGHFGKWHLGLEPYSPIEHGFDMDVPHWYGPGPAGSYVAPWKYPDFDPQTPDEHIEDRMAEEAVAFMGSTEGPFFMNYWMFSVHAPFDGKADLIAKHRERVDPKSPQRCPTYAAMIESMDDAVGTLLDAVDRLGIADRTLIVFASDNGGNMYNQVEGVPPTSNAPLRGGKATLYEGGVRGPCIVVWPGVAEPGATSDTPITSCDFFPTLQEVLGLPVKQDQQFDGESFAATLRGEETNDERSTPRAFFTYFPHSPKVPDWLPPSIAVHQGDWKLIRIFFGGADGGHRWKLFNLANDLGEQDDLSAERPELVAQLDRLIEQHLEETGAVRPLPNPAFNRGAYDLSQEGVSRMNRPRRRVASKPVAGWKPMSDCRLKMVGRELVITSLGDDPYLTLALKRPIAPGGQSIMVELESGSTEAPQLFWRVGKAKPAFTAARCVDLKRVGDRFEASISADGPVTAIRIDPGRQPGESRLRRVWLESDRGEQTTLWPTGKSDE